MILIGLGNPILGDDAAGWRVAELVEEQLLSGQLPAINRLSTTIIIEKFSTGGLSLMEQLIGFDYALVVDSYLPVCPSPGRIHSFPLDEVNEAPFGHLSSSHDTSLLNAIRVGRSLGADLPQHIDVVAVEAQNVLDFSTELSSAVEAALPDAADRVWQLLLRVLDSQH